MIQVGLLGAGGMGSCHAAAYKSISGARVVAVADGALERAQRVAAEHGARAYARMEDVFADPEVEMVDVCLPTYLHEQAVVGAAAAGKHVLTEKPVALNLEQVDRQIAAVERAGVKAMVAQVCRFMPHYARIKEYLDLGLLGRPISAVAYRLGGLPAWGSWFRDPSLSGGALLDLHIHDLDMLYYLFGKPRSVFATGVLIDGAWNQVHSCLQYDGFVATAEASFLMPPHGPFLPGFRLMGEKGCAIHPYQGSQSLSQEGAALARGNDLAFFLGREQPERPALPGVDPVQAEIEYFIARVTRSEPVEIASLEQARTVLTIVDAVRQSLETGKAIHL
jgi:predicted dehydrogenase